MSSSQIETTEKIKKLVADVKQPITPDVLVNLRNLM
jgi:hypothetical protein